MKAGKMNLIVVNKQNRIISFDSWRFCHSLQPKLHRGFTALIFNKKGELLIQQRSEQKPLWPGFWDGISSHPYKGLAFIWSAEKRLKEEMGFTCKLKKIGQFTYKVKYKNLGCEWEVCAILRGEYGGKVKPNPDEVQDYKWFSIINLKKQIVQKPDIFAPWFRMIVDKYANLARS